MTDPYKILGIAPGATDDEVKKAYRNMCRKYHPDKNPGNEAAEEMFKIVQESYDAIMEQRKNGAYGAGSAYRGAGAAEGFYGGGAAGYRGSQSSADPEATYYQAAANYINSRSYREAINVLSQIRGRNAQWYYLSALANSGLGNNYVAQEQARTAYSMEPGNVYYRQLVESMSGGGYQYQNMRQPYGSNVSSSDLCMQMCAFNICFNACCDCDPCCCC